MPDGPSSRIGGISTLKGLVLYGAIFTFAGLYIYFIVEISNAAVGKHPALDATLISTAAALAGVLGSAFALEVGTTTDPSTTNGALNQRVEAARAGSVAKRVVARIWQALSLDPRNVNSSSWPKTFGIWGLCGHRVGGRDHLRPQPERDARFDQGTGRGVRRLCDCARHRGLQVRRMRAPVLTRC